jgi:K+/H+ antiporter YhaU regulatory subunit KhtT
VFRLPGSRSLVGNTLRNSEIRATTQCNVVAMQRGGKMLVNMDPDTPFEEGDELILIGTKEAEQSFLRKFPL